MKIGPENLLDMANLRFLVVEDHGFQRWVTGNLLEGLGAKHVFSAPDGRAALELLFEIDPPIDVIISDLDMPGMDGMEFIRHVGETGTHAGVIVASALDSSLIASVEAMAKAYKVNLVGAIEKPATAKKLQAMLGLYRPAGDRVAPELEALSAAEIAQGLRDGQFEPFFQPKVDMATGRVKGAEAMARWRHPVRGIIPPARFIAVLEASRLIDSLTETILTSAAAACRSWQAKGFDATVSVNLSLSMLSDTSLADRMLSIAQSQHLEPHHVTFEVTESAAAGNLGKALENLLRLRMKGFGLSIDDYGTGYSSMERLARVPFTELKIDQSFVQNAHIQPGSRAMLESSLEMAQKLGIVAVAEGVENQAEWNLLQTLGCPLAQGYFIAKPMDGYRFLEWALQRREATT
jgi:EAL domain-containing protein (putative c-di-GMP-specific phosphodiesterase class I)/AmiR/NasT family two-component response regulator